MSINAYEASLFCLMASYGESQYLKALKSNTEKYIWFQEKKDFLEGQGWIAQFNSEQFNITDHGYFGVAYAKINDNGQFDIVFAHRQTCFSFDANGVGNIIADAQIAMGNSPAILGSSSKYINTVLTEIENAGFQIGGISHTGFS